MAVRLGAVYGSLGGREAVVISSERQPSCLMIKQALVSGLLSAGVAVLDAGELISPILRRAICQLKVKGGIHVSSPGGGEGEARLRFWDQSGLPPARSQERKIEQLYFREDFNRPPGEEVGEILNLPDLAQVYLQEILANVSVDTIARAGFRLAMGYLSPYLQRLMAPLWQRLHCIIININRGDGGRAPAGDSLYLPRGGLRDQAREVSRLVRYNNASLGAMLDREGERLQLFDETGRAIGQIHRRRSGPYWLSEREKDPVAVPINVSQAVEQLASRYRGGCFVKATHRSLMKSGQREQHRSAGLFTVGLKF